MMPAPAARTLRVLSRCCAIPTPSCAAHLPEMRDALRGRARAVGAADARLAELDALIALALGALPTRSRSRPRYVETCSTAAGAPRCTCSSTCTATRATAARRWSTWRRPTSAPACCSPASCPTTCRWCSSSLHAAAARGARIPGEIAHIVRAIFSALLERGSPYAALAALLDLAGERPQRVAAARRTGARREPGPSRRPSTAARPRDRPPGQPQPIRIVRARRQPHPRQGARIMSHLHGLPVRVYPYICLAVFLVGSLIRFDRDQYTWKSDSSQLLRAGQLRWGSNLFHIGILFLFFGHLVGLLTPHAVYEPFMSAAPSSCWPWSPAASPAWCASSA
jgi:hypothetical protein